MAETNQAAFCLSFDDRSVISFEYIHVDIESEIFVDIGICQGQKETCCTTFTERILLTTN